MPVVTLFSPGFTEVNRELNLKLSTPLTATRNVVLAAANAAVTKTPIRSCFCCFTARDHIVLTTIPSISASAAEEYRTALAAAVHSLGHRLSNIRANSC